MNAEIKSIGNIIILDKTNLVNSNCLLFHNYNNKKDNWIKSHEKGLLGDMYESKEIVLGQLVPKNNNDSTYLQ